MMEDPQEFIWIGSAENEEKQQMFSPEILRPATYIIVQRGKDDIYMSDFHFQNY